MQDTNPLSTLYNNDGENDISLDVELSLCPKASHRRACVSIYLWVLHALLLCTALALYTTRYASVPAQTSKETIRLLSVGNLISTEHSTDHDKHSKYSGPPNDENTQAWEDLIQPTFFGASEKELRATQESVEDSVKLAEDDDGYLAALGVYHELHCLRQMRLYLYRDTYYENLTDANLEWFYHHLDHCIETLRISIMCQADLSLYTFTWRTAHDNRPKSKSDSKRQCVNWNDIEAWSMARRVSLWPRLIRKGGREDTIHL